MKKTCQYCKGTGKVILFTSEADCKDCENERIKNNYHWIIGPIAKGLYFYAPKWFDGKQTLKSLDKPLGVYAVLDLISYDVAFANHLAPFTVGEDIKTINVRNYSVDQMQNMVEEEVEKIIKLLSSIQ
jgi:hypothetical protein